MPVVARAVYLPSAFVEGSARAAAVDSHVRNGGTFAATLIICAVFAGFSVAGMLMWITARCFGRERVNEDVDRQQSKQNQQDDEQLHDFPADSIEAFPKSPKDFADCDDSYLRFAQLSRNKSYWYF